MNRVLNEEILRIQEVMGLERKPLINESVGNFLSSIGDEVAESLAKRLKSFIDNAGSQNAVMIGGKMHRRQDTRAALNILEGSDISGGYDNAASKVKSVIKSVMSTDDELSRLAYYELIKHLKKNGIINSEKEFLEEAQKWRGRYPKKNTIEFLNTKFGDEWVDLKELAGKSFKTQYDSFVGAGSVYKPISAQIASAVSDGSGRKLTAREIKQAQKALRKERPKLFNKDYINALRKNINTIKAEIDELSQGYYDDLAERLSQDKMNSEEAKEMAKEYAVQIVRRLNILEAKENNAARAAMANRNIPESILEVIESDTGEFFRLYKAVWGERQAKKLSTEITDVTNDFFGDISKLLIREEKTGKIKWLKTFLNSFNPNTRFGQYLLTDSFAAFDRQWQQMIQQSGLERGKRAQYIASMAYLNSVGYVIGSTLSDIVGFLLNISLIEAINKMLPITIGLDGKGNGLTIPKFDNKKSIELRDSVDGNVILLLLKSIISAPKKIYDTITFDWEGAKSLFKVVSRTLPFGLGSAGGSFDAWLLDIIFGLNVSNIKNWAKQLQSIFSATDEAEVTPEWEDTKNSFKEWFKSNYPDTFDDVTRFKRVDNDGPDVYYVAKLAGTSTVDMYFIYDSSNKTFTSL